MHVVPHDAWLCMRDFNETLFASQHFGRSARPEWQLRAFRKVTYECSLQDLVWYGVVYTWDNRKAGGANVKARLDQAFATEDLFQRYEDICVRHVSHIEPDHYFIVAEMIKIQPGGWRSTAK